MDDAMADASWRRNAFRFEGCKDALCRIAM
jgi:hypothetical protein